MSENLLFLLIAFEDNTSKLFCRKNKKQLYMFENQKNVQLFGNTLTYFESNREGKSSLQMINLEDDPQKGRLEHLTNKTKLCNILVNL